MKNAADKVIYVGKAKILKNRLRSYFRGNIHDEKTKNLVSQIKDFEYFITNTEKEALILENNLIKKYQPHYNILLKDDKEYPFIKITTNEDFPRVFVTRKKLKDKARYFGPYTNVKSLRKVLKLLEWIFPHRTCNRKIPKDEIKYKRACINYQMKKCPAPCIGKISYDEYKKTVNNIIRFLKGNNKEIIKQLKEDMQKKAENLQFEDAALIRDKIFDIERLNNYHHLFFEDEKNRDVIGLYIEGKNAAVTVLKILRGKLLNNETYPLQNINNNNANEILKAFIMQYYNEKTQDLPYQIILQEQPDDYENLNQIFKNKLFVPQKGELKSLIQIAKKNAFNYVEENKLKYLKKKNRAILPVIELKEKLNLKNLPLKMICIDISTIQGTDTVSSLVFFENGKPKKKNYRHFIPFNYFFNIIHNI
jgi:excinuclease ABC subunit C